MTEHQKVELGGGVFEAFVIIDRTSLSALKMTIAASIGWLEQALRFAAAAGDGTVQCTAAVYDADSQEVAMQWHGGVAELAELMRRLA